MAEMIPVRVRRVVDGVLYDSDRATVIHHWDETLLLATVRFVLGRTFGGRYFLTCLNEGGILSPGPNISVTPFGRMTSIALLADIAIVGPRLREWVKTCDNPFGND